MRNFKWFIVLGAVVLGGLLMNGVQPAQADDTLPVGTYKGIINLAFHSRARDSYSMLGQTYDGSVTISWIGVGTVDIDISNAKQGSVGVDLSSVDIYDNGYIEFSKCFASVGIKAIGSFAGFYAGLNFDPEQKIGTVSLMWNGLNSTNIVWDSVQGCWKKGMSDAQLKAINAAGPTIGPIQLTVTKIDGDLISGDCRLPGWEGGGPTAHGSYAHIIDSCNWWALRNGSNGGKEWIIK